MVHYEMTKEHSLIYANDGLYGVVMVRPYKEFEDGFIQLPSIRLVAAEFFQVYYHSHETRTISRQAFEKLYIDVSAHIMDYDRAISLEMMKI